MTTVVIGGTDLIGSKTVAILRHSGHGVVSASPKSGVNTVTGEGLKEAIADTQVVIDLSNAPSRDAKAVMDVVDESFNPLKLRSEHLCVSKGRIPEIWFGVNFE